LGLALQSRLEGLSFYMMHRWQLDQAEEAFVVAWCQKGLPVLLSREER
jgi:hypothetical protein